MSDQELQPAHMTAVATTGKGWQHHTGTALGVTGLAMLWCLQYGGWIPLVYTSRFLVWMAKAAIGLGLVGIVLLFIPVIGWVILAAMLMHRHGQKQIVRELRRQDGHPSIWRPWGADWIKARRA